MSKLSLVFATNNPHKLEEIRRIVGSKLDILSLNDIDCHEDIPETADTIEGNALQKARYIKDKYGYDCFADDTGLMVEALNGRPGVYSARYAGEHCTPADNVVKLLDEMKGVENRNAYFATVIALVTDDRTVTFDGRVDGEILTEPQGHAGFGYDPVFKPVESDVSFASMSEDDKNAISHRGRATAKFLDFLKSIE